MCKSFHRRYSTIGNVLTNGNASYIYGRPSDLPVLKRTSQNPRGSWLMPVSVRPLSNYACGTCVRKLRSADQKHPETLAKHTLHADTTRHQRGPQSPERHSQPLPHLVSKWRPQYCDWTPPDLLSSPCDPPITDEKRFYHFSQSRLRRAGAK